MLTWERLKIGGALGKEESDVFRCQVPGGWLVWMSTVWLDGGSGGLTFYPDPEHRWDGGSMK